MDRKEQNAKSWNAIARPYCVVPHDDGTFSIFSGFAGRKYICNLPLRQLGEFLTVSFEEQKKIREASLAREAARAETAADLLSSLGL